MPTYHIVWELDVKADSVEDAVEQALEIQQDLENTATIFEVIQHRDDGSIPPRGIKVVFKRD